MAGPRQTRAGGEGPSPGPSSVYLSFGLAAGEQPLRQVAGDRIGDARQVDECAFLEVAERHFAFHRGDGFFADSVENREMLYVMV